MSTLSIIGAVIPYYQRGGTIATIKVWFSQTFETAEGLTILGGAPRANTFFVPVDCTVDPAVDELTYPTFSLPTTNDSSVANVRANAAIYDSGGAFVANLFTNFIIPSQLAPLTTLAALNAYNIPSNTPPSPTYPSTDVIMTLIEEGLQAAPVNGTFTINTVPRATAAKTLANGTLTDNGTDVGAPTLGYVQLGDYAIAGNGSRLEVNDTFGLMNALAGGDGANSYAGVVAVCNPLTSAAAVYVQATGYTHFYGDETGTAKMGDTQSDHNGTMIVVDDLIGAIKLVNLPTSDPHVVDQVYNSSGTLKISAG